MDQKISVSREGYLRENYRYFHLRDTEGQERDYHFHDFDKAVILLSGRVEYAVEDCTYAMQPGDVLFIRHHAIHKAVIDLQEPYDRVILYLNGLYVQRAVPDVQLMSCFEREEERCLRLDPDRLAELETCLKAYEQAQDDEGFGAQAMRDTLVTQILILLNRAAMESQGEGDPAVKSHRDDKISRILSYINENLTADLSVDALAEQAYLSKYHFMRLFKEQTGDTVHAYVQQRRLLYAARLIREGVPVFRAAEDSGFTDYSVFYRAFRKYFGVSPGHLKG